MTALHPLVLALSAVDLKTGSKLDRLQLWRVSASDADNSAHLESSCHRSNSDANHTPNRNRLTVGLNTGGRPSGGRAHSFAADNEDEDTGTIDIRDFQRSSGNFEPQTPRHIPTPPSNNSITMGSPAPLSVNMRSPAHSVDYESVRMAGSSTGTFASIHMGSPTPSIAATYNSNCDDDMGMSGSPQGSIMGSDALFDIALARQIKKAVVEAVSSHSDQLIGDVAANVRNYIQRNSEVQAQPACTSFTQISVSSMLISCTCT